MKRRQQRLRRCTQLLVDIYNKFGSETAWSWTNTDTLVKRVIYEIFQVDGEYDLKENKYKFKYKNPEPKSLSKNMETGEILFNERQVNRFKDLMTLLVNESEKGNFNHLAFIGAHDFFKTDINLNEYSQKKESVTRNVSLVDKLVIQSINKGSSREQYNDDPNINLFHLRYFRVKPISDLGNKLLATKNHGAIRKIPHLTSPEIKTFSKLSRLLLVYFYLECNEFARFKKCHNETCDNIFYKAHTREGLNEHKFCSPSCRSKYNNSNQSEAKRLCRERQKAHVRNRISKFSALNPVLKYDCDEKCDHPEIRSGQCKIILERNKEALKIARQKVK